MVEEAAQQELAFRCRCSRTAAPRVSVSSTFMLSLSDLADIRIVAPTSATTRPVVDAVRLRPLPAPEATVVAAALRRRRVATNVARRRRWPGVWKALVVATTGTFPLPTAVVARVRSRPLVAKPGTSLTTRASAKKSDAFQKVKMSVGLREFHVSLALQLSRKGRMSCACLDIVI